MLFPASLHAQDVGNVGFRTISQPIFGAQTTAAVSPNTFPGPGINCAPTNGNPCPIPNAGQNIHAVTYSISSTCTTGFFMDMRLEATNNGSTWFAISADATDQNSGSVQGSTQAGITATGLYAGYRLNLVSIACLSGQTPAVTASYSGTFSAAPTPTDAFYQASIYRKLILQNQPTTNAATQPAVTIGAPNGNTAGAFYISCFLAANGSTTSCPSGMTVTVTGFIAFGSSIGGGGGGNVVSKTFSYLINPTVSPVTQIFSVPAVSMTFSFAGAGTAGVSWSIYYLSNSTPSSNFVADPCASSGTIKQHTKANITTATTTTLVVGVPQQTIYVCGFLLNMVATASTTDTLLFEQGTSGTCATPAAISATYSSGSLAAGATNLTFGNAGATLLAASTGSDVCALTTVGTTPAIALDFTYVQQ
jgi:hypothetical protein